MITVNQCGCTTCVNNDGYGECECIWGIEINQLGECEQYEERYVEDGKN
jgi:hypothetical protein